MAVGIFGDKGLGANTDGGSLFAIQLAGVALITLWTCSTSWLLFYPMLKMGVFRVGREEEEAGLDVSAHGVSSSPDTIKNKVIAANAVAAGGPEVV